MKYPDPDKPGQWKQRSSTFQRKAEAQAWVVATLTEHRAWPDDRPRSQETFGDHMEHWLRDVAAMHRRPSTMESYRYMAKHAIGAFGTKPLADVRPGDMRAKRPRVVKKEIVPPSMAQAQTFLKHIDGDWLRGLWHFIALTRRGEALGLPEGAVKPLASGMGI